MTNRMPIAIVAACDDGFAELVTVMLMSAFTQCRSRDLTAFVIVPEDFSQQARIIESLGSHARNVTFCPIRMADLDGLKVSTVLPRSAYFRLLLSEVLPPDLDRVLYLDCDLLIRADLAPLWETDLGECCIGAVHDAHGSTRHKLDLAETLQYFNSGMMLIDLCRWRQEGIGARALAFARRHPQRLLWADQCALNAVLHQRWLSLDPSWNLMTDSLVYEVRGQWRHHSDASQRAGKGRIVHFNGTPKPSFYMCDHPMRHEYHAYRKQTVWARSRPSDHYPHNVIIKFLQRHAPPLLPLYLKSRRYI